MKHFAKNIALGLVAAGVSLAGSVALAQVEHEYDFVDKEVIIHINEAQTGDYMLDDIPQGVRWANDQLPFVVNNNTDSYITFMSTDIYSIGPTTGVRYLVPPNSSREFQYDYDLTAGFEEGDVWYRLEVLPEAPPADTYASLGQRLAQLIEDQRTDYVAPAAATTSTTTTRSTTTYTDSNVRGYW